MPDIFSYPGEANPNDVMASDPTVLRGGGGAWNIIGAGNIASAEAIGSPGISVDVVAAGIPTAESVGIPGISAVIVPASIPSDEAIGSPGIGVTISPAGIPSSEYVGSPDLAWISAGHDIIDAGGIPSEEGVGAPVLAWIVAEALAASVPGRRGKKRIQIHPSPEVYLGKGVAKDLRRIESKLQEKDPGKSLSAILDEIAQLQAEIEEAISDSKGVSLWTPPTESAPIPRARVVTKKERPYTYPVSPKKAVSLAYRAAALAEEARKKQERLILATATFVLAELLE